MAEHISFDDVKDAALDRIEWLCERLLPDGKKKGNSYITRAPWRNDRKPSLSVLLKKASWKDWGTGDGGTIIDLVMKIDNCDKITAKTTLEELLGLTPVEAKATRKKETRIKSCVGCAYLWERFDIADYCALCLDQLTEEPLTIVHARRFYGDCGPEAKLYKPKVAP